MPKQAVWIQEVSSRKDRSEVRDQASRALCASTSLGQAPAAAAICRPGRLTPTGIRRDHETRGPCFLNRVLPVRFPRPDLQYRPQRSASVRALFEVSPCPADEMTCDRSFPAMVWL